MTVLVPADRRLADWLLATPTDELGKAASSLRDSAGGRRLTSSR
jgi:hypothetical protein